MTRNQTPTLRDILVVGSVALPTAEDVFRAIGTTLGTRVKRLPDGETGDRRNWIQWQEHIVKGHSQLAIATDDPDRRPEPRVEQGKHVTMRFTPSYRIADGVAPADLVFDNLGYADAALESFETFRRLKSQGDVPEDTRFQVSLPTPVAFLEHFIARRSQAAVEGPYEACMLTEIMEIVDHVPYNELAIQWDVSKEMAIWEGLWSIYFEEPQAGIIDRLARLGDAVPETVELGYHLCYGDFNHLHWKEPEDTANLVAVANRVSAAVGRDVQWIHLPVPRDRADDAYFAALSAMKLRPETELFLGLVHHTDGVEGTRARIATAEKFVTDFGISTECGMGRRPPDTISELLRIHADV